MTSTNSQTTRPMIDLDAIEAREDEHYAVRVDVPALVAEVRRLAGALSTIREWAHTNHGGAKTPAEVWPGLAAALAAGGV